VISCPKTIKKSQKKHFFVKKPSINWNGNKICAKFQIELIKLMGKKAFYTESPQNS